MAKFDPILISYQIVCLQCFFYLSMAVFLSFFYAIFDFKISLDHFFTPRFINFISMIGWIETGCFIASAIAGYCLYFSTLWTSQIYTTIIFEFFFCKQGLSPIYYCWEVQEMCWFYVHIVFNPCNHLYFLLSGNLLLSIHLLQLQTFLYNLMYAAISFGLGVVAGNCCILCSYGFYWGVHLLKEWIRRYTFVLAIIWLVILLFLKCN